jgi:hypothetical protein
MPCPASHRNKNTKAGNGAIQTAYPMHIIEFAQDIPPAGIAASFPAAVFSMC